MASLSTVALTAKLHIVKDAKPRSQLWINPARNQQPSTSLFQTPQFGSLSRNVLLICTASRRAEKRKAQTSQLLDGTQLKDGDDDTTDGAEEYVRPVLPGDEPDFWEGEQWEALGFAVKYLWAIGIVVSLIGCFVAVRYYNDGATDFKDTEVFKEAMESQGFVGTPSESKIFEESSSKDAPVVGDESST